MIKKIVKVIIVFNMPLFLSGMDILKKDKKSDENIVNQKQTDSGDVKIQIGSTGVPPLKIPQGALISDGLSLNKKTGKLSVKSLNHVSHIQQVQNTYRQSTSRRSGKQQNDSIIISGVDDKIDAMQELQELGADIQGIQPKTARKRNVNISSSSSPTQSQSPSDEKMWALLKKVNPIVYEYAQTNLFSLDDVMSCSYDFSVAVMPKVYDFAKQHNLGLSEIMELSHLLEKFDVEPKALAELVDKHSGGGTDIQTLVKHFKDIEEDPKNPDAYIDLTLDFFRKTCFTGGQQQRPSPLDTAQVDAQNKQIKSQRSQIYYQFGGLLVTLLTTFGAGAWAIVKQIISHCPSNTTM